MVSLTNMKVIDSHTAGEPTRVVISGGPNLGNGSLADRANLFKEQFDDYRQSIILEPRGSNALVGALLCPPVDKSCVSGVIFFNNTDYLGMCGHASIGVIVTLYYLGKIKLGKHKIETPVGIVTISLTGPNEASLENVVSYCYQQQVEVNVDGLGVLNGDVAWGGNWFFLVNSKAPYPLKLANIKKLTSAAIKVKKALVNQNITGKNGEEIDHIEFFSLTESTHTHSRNFVLCPGDEYDRSPCGTGTSAKLACLASKGLLKPKEEWIQESIVGTQFISSYHLNGQREIIPKISGEAYICSETTLIHQIKDPFINGIKP